MISAALAIIEDESQRNELSDIYERNIKTFYSISFSKLNNKQDAEDAIQEAFLAIAKNPAPLFNIPSDKRVSYINVIVRNTAFKMWNKRNKVYDYETDLDDTVVDERISIEETMLSDYSCQQILRFINTLPETTKSAVYLKTYLGLKNGDIANALGISEDAAKKRITRAISQIKQYMEGLKYE